MEGTHNPIKVPSAFSPLKKRNSENNNDNIAAVNNSLSAVVNFLSITFFLPFVKFTQYILDYLVLSYILLS